MNRENIPPNSRSDILLCNSQRVLRSSFVSPVRSSFSKVQMDLKKKTKSRWDESDEIYISQAWRVNKNIDSPAQRTRDIFLPFSISGARCSSTWGSREAATMAEVAAFFTRRAYLYFSEPTFYFFSSSSSSSSSAPAPNIHQR